MPILTNLSNFAFLFDYYIVIHVDIKTLISTVVLIFDIFVLF